MSLTKPSATFHPIFRHTINERLSVYTRQVYTTLYTILLFYSITLATLSSSSSSSSSPSSSVLSLPSNCPLLYTLIPSTTTSTPTTTALRPNIYLHLQPLSTLSPSHPIPYIANAHSPLSIAFHSLRLRPARHHYHHSFACLRLLALALDPHYTTPQPHPPLPTNNSAATPLSSPLLPSPSPLSPPLPGLKRTPTATIPSPHSLAAILSPDDSVAPERLPSPKRTHHEAFSADRQPYLQPASPSSHDYRQSVASQLPRPDSGGPDDGTRALPLGGLEEKKPQKMVRSSIACARCRRSKVKCKKRRFSLGGDPRLTD